MLDFEENIRHVVQKNVRRKTYCGTGSCIMVKLIPFIYTSTPTPFLPSTCQDWDSGCWTNWLGTIGLFRPYGVLGSDAIVLTDRPSSSCLVDLCDCLRACRQYDLDHGFGPAGRDEEYWAAPWVGASIWLACRDGIKDKAFAEVRRFLSLKSIMDMRTGVFWQTLKVYSLDVHHARMSSWVCLGVLKQYVGSAVFSSFSPLILLC